MAVRNKGRRKLMINNRQFVWWVGESNECGWVGDVLTVTSHDRRFFVRFYLGQQPEQRFLVVEGREFAGLPDAGGSWLRVRCPEWSAGASVKPSDVRRLIEWSLTPDQQRVRVDHRGADVSRNASI